MSHVIQPGAIGIDCSFGYPNLVELKAAGVRFNVRYASQPDSNPKNWTRAQIAEHHELGIAVAMIHEQVATDASGGAAVGTAKADVFLRYAELIGYPVEAPALVACDSSPAPAMVEYAAAFEAKVRAAGFRHVGVYGGIDLIRWCAEAEVCADVLWQAYGWSAVRGSSTIDALAKAEARWPGCLYDVLPNDDRTAFAIHPATHVFQRLGRRDLPLDAVTTSIDENIVMRPTPFWLPGAPTQETDMPARYVRTDGAQFILGPNGDDKVHISPAYSDLLGAGGSALLGPSADIDAKLALLADGGSPRDLAGGTDKTVREEGQLTRAAVEQEGGLTRSDIHDIPTTGGAAGDVVLRIEAVRA